MQKVGFGVIGCGVISTAYLKAAQRFANLELRAVADMRSAAAEKQAAAFGVPAMRVDQLLKRDDVEIVVNLTVPLAHTDVEPGGPQRRQACPFREAARRQRRRGAQGHRPGRRPRACASAAHPTPSSAAATRRRARLIDDGAIGRPVAGTAFFMCPGHERWHPDARLLLSARRRADARHGPLLHHRPRQPARPGRQRHGLGRRRRGSSA